MDTSHRYRLLSAAMALAALSLLWLPGCGSGDKEALCGPFPLDAPLGLELYQPGTHEDAETGTAWISGHPHEFRIVGSWLVTEGDILLGTASALPATGGDVRASSIFTVLSRTWPQGRVPYEIAPGLPI